MYCFRNTVIVFLTLGAADPWGHGSRCCSTSPWAVWGWSAELSLNTARRSCATDLVKGWWATGQTTAWCVLASALGHLIFILGWMHGFPSYQPPLPGTGSLKQGLVLGLCVDVLRAPMVKWIEACSAGNWCYALNPSSIPKAAGCLRMATLPLPGCLNSMGNISLWQALL